MTPFRNSTRDYCLRLPFATALVTPIRDSRSRLMTATHDCDPHLQLTVFTTPSSYDSTTDRQTVCLPCLASTPSYCTPSCPPPLVALCLLTLPLAHHLLQRPLPPPPPPCQAPCHHPCLYHTLCPSLHPPSMGTCHCSFNETTPYYCRGPKLEIRGHLPLPYISRRLLNVGIGHSPI